MNKITYETIVKVYIEKRFTGTIKPVGNGWRYFPKANTFRSIHFPSVEACQQSLEMGHE